jgi:hypothetical protein
MCKRLSVPGVLLPGSAEGLQPSPTSCYVVTTEVLRGGVVGVPLDAGAVAAAGPSCDAVVVGPPIRNLSFKPTLK